MTREMSVHIEGLHYNVVAKNYDVAVQSCVADDAQLMLRYVHRICGHLGHANIDFSAKLPLGHLEIRYFDCVHSSIKMIQNKLIKIHVYSKYIILFFIPIIIPRTQTPTPKNPNSVGV